MNKRPSPMKDWLDSCSELRTSGFLYQQCMLIVLYNCSSLSFISYILWAHQFNCYFLSRLEYLQLDKCSVVLFCKEFYETLHKRVSSIKDHHYRPLSRYSCSARVWSNTQIKHTTGKNKPSLVSALIFRVTDQSTVKCHHFENCKFYRVLYGELPYN